MKKAAYIILLISAILTIGGCTHNNGDIGPWFGQWKIERIDKNGEPDTEYQCDCMLCFQSSVVSAVWASNDGYSTNAILKYGNWEERDGYMFFEFKERDNSPLLKLHFDQTVCTSCGHANEGIAAPEKCPECGGEDFKIACALKILKRDGKDKQLQLTKDDGTVYTYYLVKW